MHRSERRAIRSAMGFHKREAMINTLTEYAVKFIVYGIPAALIIMALM